MITKLVILAFITGLLSGLVAIGAHRWARALALNMNWWKWLLSALWYILLLFFIFAAFTLMGEGETSAGWKVLGVAVVVLVVLGAGLARILLAKRKQAED